MEGILDIFKPAERRRAEFGDEDMRRFGFPQQPLRLVILGLRLKCKRRLVRVCTGGKIREFF